MSFESAIQEFKRLEKHEDIIPLISNPEAQRIVMAWTRISVKRKEGYSCEVEPPDTNDRWKWLWGHVSWSPEDLRSSTGLPAPVLARVFEVVKWNRLIYPDGSVSAIAAKYLQHVANLAAARLKLETSEILKRVKGE